MSFQGGLQSKTDALQLQPPALLELQNTMFNKIGALNKRPGYDILNNTTTNGNIINSAYAIDSFNNELNLFDNQNIYTYISSTNNWTNRGTAISLINTNNQIIRSNSSQQLNPDIAYCNGLEVYVWEDSRGGVRCSVLDTNTNSYCLADQKINGIGVKPKVFVLYDNLFYTTDPLFIIFFSDGLNNLFYCTINPNNPGVITPQVSLVNNCATGFVYDFTISQIPFGGTGCLISYIAASSGVQALNIAYIFNSSGTIVQNSSNLYTFPSGVVVNSLSLCADTKNGAYWFNWGQTDGYNVSTLQSSWLYQLTFSLSTPQIIDTGYINTLAAIESPNTKGAIQLIYEIASNNPSNEIVKSVEIAPIVSGTTCTSYTITNLITQRSVGLASKPFTYNNNTYIQLAYQSPLQSTYFQALIGPTKFTIVGKVAAQVGGGLRTNNMLSEVVEISPGVFKWANLIKGRFISEDNVSFSLLGVNSTKVDFTNVNKFNSVTFSNNLLFVGGILQSYDGVLVTEQNFHLFPENISSTIIPGAGALSAGQYQYSFVYSWMDKFGQIQYSGVSNTLTVTTPANAAVKLTIPTLRLTTKPNVIIKIYRTQVNQTTFQEVTSELAPLSNNTNVDYVVFTDTAADINIAGNQTIYTTGGILPNSATPSCSMIVLYQDRVMVSGLDDPNLIWFSKNRVNNSNFNTIPAEFSADLTISITQAGGPITALAVMDQNLIIFKESAIYVLSGDGPNDEGGGDNFPDPQLVTKTVGCINPNSIVFTDAGIMFQTPNKGIWLLDRSLGPPNYIGAGVDDIAKEYLVSSATLDVNSNSVIFTTYNGPAMVYDYLIQQWSSFTNHQSVDSVIFDDQFCFVKANGFVYKQNPNIFYDGLVNFQQVPIVMEFITPWISFASLLGYQSIFKAFLLGTYKSPHNLNVSIGYNFNNTFTQAGVINTSQTAGSNVWGADGYYGNSTPWGGQYQPYIYQINMPIQKCSSFRLKVSDSQSSPYTEGFTISSLLFELGIMPDGIRVPVSNKVGLQ